MEDIEELDKRKFLMKIALIGKRHEDICLSVNTNVIGETNNIPIQM